MKSATNLVVKIIVLILVFMLGFLSCAGAIVGVALYAYKNISLDTLGVDTDAYIDRDNAEIVLPSLTIENLVNEYFEVSAFGEEISINFLVDRYGLILPEMVDGMLPDTIREMHIASVFSQEGIDELLKTFYIGNFLGLEGEEIAGAQEGEDKYEWYDPATGEKANVLNSMIANYNLYDFMNGGIDTQGIIDALTIADVMEMKVHENVPVYLDGVEIPSEELALDAWYSRGGAPSANIMSAIADSKINDVESTLHGFTIMQIMGYVEYNGNTYEARHVTGENEHYELILAEGLAAELSGISLDTISNGGLEAEVQDLPLYIALGYKKAADGSFTNNGVPVEGFMATVCEYKVSELEKRVGEVTVGEISGYTKINVAADGDEPVYEYYTEYDENDPTKCVKASGIVGSIADLTIDDLNDEKKLSERVEGLTVATLLDYERDDTDGKYYKYNENNVKTPVTGVMSVIAGSSLNNVQDTIDTSSMGEVLGYTKGTKHDAVLTDEDGKIIYDEHGEPLRGDVDWWYDGETPVHIMMNTISNYKFNELDTLSSSLSIQDIIPAEERESGFIKLVPANTKINEISSAVNDVFNTTTVTEYMDSGVIVIEDEDKRIAFKQAYGGLTFQGLINVMAENLIATP